MNRSRGCRHRSTRQHQVDLASCARLANGNAHRRWSPAQLAFARSARRRTIFSAELWLSPASRDPPLHTEASNAARLGRTGLVGSETFEAPMLHWVMLQLECVRIGTGRSICSTAMATPCSPTCTSAPMTEPPLSMDSTIRRSSHGLPAAMSPSRSNRERIDMGLTLAGSIPGVSCVGWTNPARPALK